MLVSWLIIITILIILGIFGIWAYKSIQNISNNGCILASKNSDGYTCSCEKGLTQDNCISQGGIWRTKPCETDQNEWNTICRDQLLGSCITATGCQYPNMKSECQLSQGTWNAGKKCQTQESAPSQDQTLWT